jgi:hypothetical protein
LTKIDDVLLELSRTVAAHYKHVPSFQYNKETYHLIDNYTEVPYTNCAVCGEYPIFEVSVISSDHGKTIRIDNKCIDRLTGQNLSEWSRNNRQKRQNIIANRKYINKFSSIIESQNSSNPSLQLPKEDVEKLKVILEQLYKGLNLTTTQQQIADFYISL